MSEVAAEAAERALAAAGGGADVLVRASAERSLLLRFAHSRPTQATSVDDVSIEVCVVVDGRVGRARTNATDDDALRRCGDAARASAEATARAGAAGEYPGFPQPRPGRAHHGHDPDTAAIDARTGGAALAAAFAECDRMGAAAHGVWTVGEVATAVASGAGGLAAERVTDAFMKVTAIAPSGRSGYASGAAPGQAGLDPAGLAQRAAAKAAARGTTARLEPGTYPVVLAVDAVGELVSWLGSTAFNGLEHAEGRGALVGRLGTRVAAATVNLADSPRHPRTLPHAFDAEGVPKAPRPLIEDGVARGVVHDVRSAALAGAESTGHALVPGGDSSGPLPTNLVLAGGGCPDEETLCGPVERGVYVTRLWYTNAVRPKETLITGVTRDGTFLIEDGKVTRPLEDLRLTDRVLGVFERCEELTSATSLASEGEFYGRRFATGVVCPAVRSRMRFTA